MIIIVAVAITNTQRWINTPKTSRVAKQRHRLMYHIPLTTHAAKTVVSTLLMILKSIAIPAIVHPIKESEIECSSFNVKAKYKSLHELANKQRSQKQEQQQQYQRMIEEFQDRDRKEKRNYGEK